MIDSLKQDIIFEEAGYSKLEAQIHQAKFSQLFIFMDKNTRDNCYQLLENCFKDLKPNILILPEGEKHKTLDTVQKCYQLLTEHQADRKSLILSLSGGLLSDLVGYVAASYKRGVQFAIIPTTLLSMCDAAIGGKTGVNFSSFKNHIGAFYPAKWVYINPVFLSSLPQFELLSGKGELIKYALIQKPSMLKSLQGEIDLTLIQDAVSIKQEICLRDFKEKADRKLLNFGHTFGHAIESLLYTSMKVSHGHCVAIGMMVAIECSRLEGILNAQVAKDLIAFISQQFSFIQLSDAQLNQACENIQQDKKNQDGKIFMVLLKDLGNPIFDYQVEVVTIAQAYRNLKTEYQLA